MWKIEEKQITLFKVRFGLGWMESDGFCITLIFESKYVMWSRLWNVKIKLRRRIIRKLISLFKCHVILMEIWVISWVILMFVWNYVNYYVF
jgi:hypothetical protein